MLVLTTEINTCSYEVLDLEKSPWFRMTAGDSVSEKKVILNTGVHHATLQHTTDGSWSISIAGACYPASSARLPFLRFLDSDDPGSSTGERRVSIEKDHASQQYNVFVHSYPYQSDQAKVDLDLLNPTLRVLGNPRDYEYW